MIILEIHVAYKRICYVIKNLFDLLRMGEIGWKHGVAGKTWGIAKVDDKFKISHKPWIYEASSYIHTSSNARPQ